LTATELLSRLESLDIQLELRDRNLRVNARRGALTEELKAEIAAHKPELLELLAARATANEIPRADRSGPLALSYFQERLWVLNKFDPTDTAYNLATTWPSAGPVDLEVVRAALRRMLERHEALRTCFRDEDGVPSAVLMPVDSVPLEVLDVRDLADDEVTSLIASDIAKANHTPFDLATDTPTRFRLYRCSGDRVVTVVSAHHIAVDAWSLSLLGEEIEVVYAGRDIPDAPAIQYTDFAAWQRRTQDARVIGAELDWWKTNLTGAPPVSTLPADVARATGSAARGEVFEFRLDRTLTRGLTALVKEEGATIYHALVAACAIVLRWHSDQDDVVLGSPMGGRERPEFESVIGPFVNVLLLRLGLANDPSFAELLRSARNVVLDAHAHRNVSFERLVEHIKPARSFDHTPLFQVAVVLHNASNGTRKITSGGAIFPLTWFVQEVDGELACVLEYRSDLYSSETIRKFARRLQALLAQAVADRTRPLSAFALLAPEEEREVLEAFNAPEIAIDPSPFIAQFERQAAMTPDAPAVTFGRETLTYRELNERANRIARWLAAKDLGPETVVGLCLPRSLDMMAALLGIQKCGAAYLPLDPDFPVERLRFMIGDSGARALVVDDTTAASVEVPAGIATLNVAAQHAEIDAMGSTNLDRGPIPESLAYVIYTSGSTGRPKGVRIAHSALSNFLGSMRREPGLTPADVVAAITTLSFDIAGLELFLPLVCGARVLLVPRDVARNGEQLARLLDQAGVTLLQATPATWRMLVEAGWSGRPGLRGLTGGEALQPELAEAILPRLSELWNMYGPTETTIWSTVARVQSGESITIGRPIANTRVYVLDAARQLLPVGVAGDLWIGGDGVALGYHARPDLDAERFVSDPWSPRSGARMYTTGDRARWRADGTLEYLGRRDQQVKVRGYRIELGEIESILESRSEVRQAKVVPWKQTAGDVRLVGYLVYAPGEDLTASEVRGLLRAELPDYMIPSLFVTLETIPLTENGKVDLKRLPDPFAHAASNSGTDRPPPAPGLETVLAEIWQNVLHVASVSAEDNFFDLGGHSLLALRVTNTLQKRTGWQMDPRLLFFQPLRQIAAAAPSGLEIGDG
jgi:amino acid adenylation domain-containing protein